jgi:Transglutaminase-like superfamily
VIEYFLSEDVALCAVGHHVVFLDLATQKYIGLDCGKNSALLRDLSIAVKSVKRSFQVGEDSDVETLAALSKLLARGIISRIPPIPGAMPIEVAIATPTSSFVSIPRPSLEALPVLAISRLIRSYISIRVRLKLFGLKPLIARIRSRHRAMTPTITATDLDNAAQVIRCFCRIRPWLYTADQHCLLDSLVLTEYLHLYKYPATLVLAILQMPFAAHAWVQLGDRLVDETVETARMYCPILAA